MPQVRDSDGTITATIARTGIGQFSVTIEPRGGYRDQADEDAMERALLSALTALAMRMKVRFT